MIRAATAPDPGPNGRRQIHQVLDVRPTAPSRGSRHRRARARRAPPRKAPLQSRTSTNLFASDDENVRRAPYKSNSASGRSLQLNSRIGAKVQGTPHPLHRTRAAEEDESRSPTSAVLARLTTSPLPEL